MKLTICIAFCMIVFVCAILMEPVERAARSETYGQQAGPVKEAPEISLDQKRKTLEWDSDALALAKLERTLPSREQYLEAQVHYRRLRKAQMEVGVEDFQSAYLAAYNFGMDYCDTTPSDVQPNFTKPATQHP